MSKKHELKQALAKVCDEIEAMGGRADDEGFRQDVYDLLKERFVDLNKQIGRFEEAERIAANASQLLSGHSPHSAAPSGRMCIPTKIKNFWNTEVGGKAVSAADQAYVVGTWFKATILDDPGARAWCRERGVPIQRAQGESVDSAGGFLVPEEMMASIIVLREQFGVFRKECHLVPMGSDSLNWPRRTGGLTAYFVDDNQTVTESSAAWDSVNLSAKKLAVLTRLSAELAEDAVISIADWLVGEIAYALASKEDDCGFNGDGTGTYGRMRGLSVLAVDGNHNASKFTAAAGHNTFATLTMADLTGLMGTLPEYAQVGAKWIMSQQCFFTCIGGLAAGAGGNRLDILSQGIEKRFLGFPVTISQKLPIIQTTLSTKPMLFFGNLNRAALMGERRGVTLMRSEHQYFEFNQIGLRGTERFHINVHDLGDNVTAGPLVTLAAP
jgi:HK97 family phage major capsid protein